MKKLWTYRGLLAKLLLLGVAVWAALQLNMTPAGEARTAGAASGPSLPQNVKAALPQEGAFRPIAETEMLRLRLDASTGHFIVEDKRNSAVWRSYPNPSQWEKETIAGLWKQHLTAPLMVEYMDFSQFNSKPKLTNFLTLGGKVTEVTEIPGGVRMVYDMPALELSIPVQLRIVDDCVETKILDAEIQEGKYSMTWLRLYPFFGAEQSAGQDGYMLIPDGSGALIRFDAHASSARRVYEERVYGADGSFNNERSSRLNVNMPVFGMKSGSKAFLAVLEEGAEYAKVFASPGGVYSQYNWVTGQMLYRSTYYQITNKNKKTGFVSYNKEERFGTDRTVRYFLLDEQHANYVGMAQRYRQYLMEEQGVPPLKNAPDHLPMYISIIGGGQEKGVIGDRFVPITPYDDAANMMEALKAKGISQLNVTYLGWHKDGYTSYGGYAPPEEKLGGASGLKSMLERAHALGAKVNLGLHFQANNRGGSFSASHHGVRDLSGTLLSDRLWRSSKEASYASEGYIQTFLKEDLQKLKNLGADGVFLQSAGITLNSDFNTKYGTDRTGALTLQTEQFRQAREIMGNVQGENMNFYAVAEADFVSNLYDDYSYDLFTDRSVPFAQIALHGLKPYTSGYENQRQQFRNAFLKDIEYGAAPSYLFTQAPTRDLTSVYGLELTSTTFSDWEHQAAEEYTRYNEALGDVQTEFITGHRELAPGVRETVYSGGKRIVVNYNDTEYRDGDLQVPAKDYAIVKGRSS